MSEGSNAPGTGFWVIGVLALLWYLIGFAMYYGFVTATPEQLAGQLTDAQLAVITATPTWVTAANATAVTFGVLACVLLLLRQKLAVPAFAVSLAAAVVQDVYVFGMSDSVAAFGMQPVIIQGLVLLFGAALLWYALRKKNDGIIA